MARQPLSEITNRGRFTSVVAGIAGVQDGDTSEHAGWREDDENDARAASLERTAGGASTFRGWMRSEPGEVRVGDAFGATPRQSPLLIR